MPTPAETLKALIDQQITNKTLPFSISNVDEGNLMKAIIDLPKGSELSQQLVVNVGANSSVGGAETGDVYPEGTAVEDILRDILIKALPVSFTPPSLALTESGNPGNISYELGTSLNLTFNIAFTKNDAGNEASRRLLKNNVEIATATPYTDLVVVITETPIAYKGELTYLQGACKVNNLGNQDCIGRIQAGTIISNILNYSGYRKAFYGVPASVPANSTEVRALTGNTPNPQNGTSFIINIPIGAANVVFAYPADKQDVSSVKFQEFANSEVKGNFTKITLNVAGNNSYSPISYKLFYYTPIEPFQTTATYVVTI